MTVFGRVKKIHLIGIGGSGMSSIAEILLNLGYNVTGSDINRSEITDKLVALGATVYIGHKYENVDESDVLVYSAAIPSNNPEIHAAHDLNIPIIGRAEMLAELMRMKRGIGIAGTHGKSTTTSLIGELLTFAGIDPTIIIGGRAVNLAGSSKLGAGEYLVVEADEFDKTFLKLTPTIAIVTTLEKEHMECYDGLDDLKDSFTQFLNSVPFYGASIVCLDERSIQELIPNLRRRIITYGLSTQSDIRATKISFHQNRSRFHVEAYGNDLGEIEVALLGLHNVRNVLAAVSVGLELDIPFEKIAQGISEFGGVYRRFHVYGERKDILVVDDFAHHPTEIRVTLEGVKMGYDRRIIAVFQPHLFSRTRDFADDFGKAFLDCDVLIVTSIYPAREKPIEGITGNLIAQAARDFGHRNVMYIPDRDSIPEKLLEIVRKNDIVLVLGAGDVNKVAIEFYDMLDK